MDAFRAHGKWLAFGACFLAVGVPYWMIPYSAVTLPSSLMGPGLLVVVAAAAVLTTRSVTTFASAVVMTGSSVPAAVAMRVLVEVLANPKTHNLWPFELVMAAAVAFPCAVLGAGLGSLAARFGSPRRSGIEP
jgi:hypothetical protein